jgi:hypothetical protein
MVIATVIGNNYLCYYTAQRAKVKTGKNRLTQGDSTTKTRPKRKCK